MHAAVALTIVGAILLATVGLGVWGVRRVQMDPAQLIVGGRSFGTVFLWVLLAGEIYSSFTFLGAAGWAYSKGAPAYYILCYATLAYILSYFLGPAIWRVSARHQLLTGPDFFVAQYGSRSLGAWVSLVGVVFAVPYTTLQLTGISVLLRIAGYDSFQTTVAVGAAFALIILFVFACGLRGMAWASLAKDVLVLLAVLFAGIWLPIHFFGSPARVIDRVLVQHPGWLTLNADLSTRGTLWFVSTVILTALGFYMWPHSMASLYSAHGEEPIRRNAIYLPLYQLLLLLVYFAGWTALLLIPGLEGKKADESFMLVVQRYYPAWVLGLIAGAGCLAGLIPAAVQLLAAASILSKNVLADQFGLALEPKAQVRATRAFVLLVACAAFGFWLLARVTLVGLLLIAYNGITQLFPGVALSFRARRPAALSIGLGILTGLVILIWAACGGVTLLAGINIGLLALGANFVVVAGCEWAVPQAGTDYSVNSRS
jgi:SSS family solute:Na+ symporter